jgi:hypothetical protein
MSAIQPRLIGLIAAAIIAFASGIWISRRGKPYGSALLNLHKLASILAVVIVGTALHRAYRLEPFSPVQWAAVGPAALLIIVAIASGGIVSAVTKAPPSLLWLHRIAPYIAVIAVLCSYLLVLRRPAVHAASTGRIEGRVCDGESHIPIFYGSVVVVGAKMGGATLMDGRYSIMAIPEGTYSVKAMMWGYEPKIIDDVHVSGGTTIRLDFDLVYTDSLAIFECPHGTSYVCEEHGGELIPTIMSLRYPMESDSKNLDAGDAEVYERARKQYFPHADVACEPVMHGGRRTVTVYMCPQCRAAHDAWLDEHERIKDAMRRRAKFR